MVDQESIFVNVANNKNNDRTIQNIKKFFLKYTIRKQNYPRKACKKERKEETVLGESETVICSLTGLGRVSLRKDFKSPPAMSSSKMKRGKACKLTPMQRTIF